MRASAVRNCQFTVPTRWLRWSCQLWTRLPEILNRGNAVSQTLPSQHTEFDLRDIEPARVLGGIVDLKTVDQSSGLFGWKDFVERGRGMRIQVAHDGDD